MFNTVGIVGVGLIGSSLAFEIKDKSLAQNILGFDNNQKNLDVALNSGAIDGYASLDELGICDFVIIATPVSNIPAILKTAFEKMKKGSIVIDVGSVKGAIIDKIKNSINSDVFYVPIHPIAGIEKFGSKAAKRGLFDNAYCIITPFEETNRFAMSKIENFIKALNMKAEIMDPYDHDWVFAYISHLPHIIAYGLVGLIEEKSGDEFKFIGGGFRDFTRIAASSEKMWNDIFIMNKNNIIESIEEFTEHIDKMKEMIIKDDIKGLMQYLKKARLFKESLDEK